MSTRTPGTLQWRRPACAHAGGRIALLVFDGRAQVETGTRLFDELPADSAIRALVQAGDPSRPEANTTAAFSVGFVVAFVYLYQALFNTQVADERSR